MTAYEIISIFIGLLALLMSFGSLIIALQHISEPTEGYIKLYQTRDYGDNPVPVYIPEKYATTD